MAEDDIVLNGSKEELMERIPPLLDMLQLIKSRDLGNIYGIPTTAFQDWNDFCPQVRLHFYKLLDPKTKDLVNGDITFALANETHETITEAKAKALAEKIKTKFAVPREFVWSKGKIITSYVDKKKGYIFKLNVTSEAEGRRIIENVLDLQGHSPDWKRLRVNTLAEIEVDPPSKERIYGELRRPPRRRRVADIEFRFAEMHVWGYPKAISLVDTTGHRSTPLVHLV